MVAEIHAANFKVDGKWWAQPRRGAQGRASTLCGLIRLGKLSTAIPITPTLDGITCKRCRSVLHRRPQLFNLAITLS